MTCQAWPGANCQLIFAPMFSMVDCHAFGSESLYEQVSFSLYWRVSRVNVRSGTSISGRPMSAPAAQQRMHSAPNHSIPNQADAPLLEGSCGAPGVTTVRGERGDPVGAMGGKRDTKVNSVNAD